MRNTGPDSKIQAGKYRLENTGSRYRFAKYRPRLENTGSKYRLENTGSKDALLRYRPERYRLERSVRRERHRFVTYLEMVKVSDFHNS